MGSCQSDTCIHRERYGYDTGLTEETTGLCSTCLYAKLRSFIDSLPVSTPETEILADLVDGVFEYGGQSLLDAFVARQVLKAHAAKQAALGHRVGLALVAGSDVSKVSL